MRCWGLAGAAAIVLAARLAAQSDCRGVNPVYRQAGKDQTLSTNYSDFDPTAGHVFGGIGLRFGF